MFRSFIIALLLTSSARASTECGPNQAQMSVEGVEGTFCLDNSPICIADISNGACPEPQDGLTDGSHCGLVASGVYGCKVGPRPDIFDFDGSLPDEPTDGSLVDEPADGQTDEPTETPTQAPVDSPTAPTPAASSTCPEGLSEMSVEGAEGIFCVGGWPICSAQVWNGACPGIQNGLPNGSYCGIVASGVYGCKANSEAEPTSVTPVSATPSSSSTAPEPVSEAPIPLYNGACATDYTPMSIESAEPIFCVREPACAGTRSSGNCPEPQPGLEFGSYCDIVRTGVYGCKVYNGTAAAYPALPACDGTNGDTPVSVVGAGTFCAPQPVCSGNIAGKCPSQQEGLEQDSVCTIIGTGVYGCVLPAM